MLVHISICSLIGGLSVSTISGVGSAIVLSIQGDNQFKYWFVYFLLGFVTVTLVTEIIFLNKALELFNTAMVTPTYYVLFTFSTLVTSIILFQGLDSSPIQIVTIVLGFLTICAGICLLQLSKIDPEDLCEKEGVGLDRSTTFLIRASQSYVSTEKGKATALEDPGVDTVRGGLGVIGSLVRARSVGSSRRFRASADEYRRMADEQGGMQTLCTDGKHDLERYELHDRPMQKGSPVMGQVNQLPLPHLPFGRGPQKRDTAISFASGSEGPHGHRSMIPGHSGSSMSNSEKQASTTAGGSILMGTSDSMTGSRRYYEDPMTFERSNNLTPDEYDHKRRSIRIVGGPRTPRSHDQNQPSQDIVYMNRERGGTRDANAEVPSSEYEDQSKDYGEGDTDTDTSASSTSIGKRSGRFFPTNRNKASGPINNSRVEVEELLSPIMRNDLEAATGAFPRRR